MTSYIDKNLINRDPYKKLLRFLLENCKSSAYKNGGIIANIKR